MRQLRLFLILIVIISALACQGAQGAPQDTRRGGPNVEWLFQSRGDDPEIGLPRVRVFLVVNGRRIRLLDHIGIFFVVPRERYADLEIPSTAIAACQGTEPGAGTYMYVIRRNRQLIVYRRHWDAQDGGTSRYRRLRVIPLPR